MTEEEKRVALLAIQKDEECNATHYAELNRGGLALSETRYKTSGLTKTPYIIKHLTYEGKRALARLLNPDPAP